MSRRTSKTRTVIDLTPGRCTCGCGETTSPKAKFRPGHDQRLKGLLLAAHRDGVSVSLIDPDGDPTRAVVPALEAAERLSTERHDWRTMLAARGQASHEPPNAKDEQ